MRAPGYHGLKAKPERQGRRMVTWWLMEAWCKEEGDKCDPNVLQNRKLSKNTFLESCGGMGTL